MSIRSAITGAAILAALFLCVWGYGQYQYKQGASDEKAAAVLAAISIEQGMQYERDKADAEYRGAVLAREAAHQTVAAQRARIVGLLDDLHRAKATRASVGFDDARVDGIGILIECIGEYEQMGAEAARLADKVNGLQGYIKVLAGGG